MNNAPVNHKPFWWHLITSVIPAASLFGAVVWAVGGHGWMPFWITLACVVVAGVIFNIISSLVEKGFGGVGNSLLGRLGGQNSFDATFWLITVGLTSAGIYFGQYNWSIGAVLGALFIIFAARNPLLRNLGFVTAYGLGKGWFYAASLAWFLAPSIAPWCLAALVLVHVLAWRVSAGNLSTGNEHGSATWWGLAEGIEWKHFFKPGDPAPDARGVALGRWDNKQGYDPRFRVTGHVMTIAPTRTGKGLTLISNLLETQSSVFVVDIKGENYAVTHNYRRKVLGQNVVKIDPFGVLPGESASFDPIAWLAGNPVEWVADSGYLADALVVSSGKEEDSHWTDMAKTLIQGLILWVATDSIGLRNTKSVDTDENYINAILGITEKLAEAPASLALESHTIGEVRRILMLGKDEFATAMKAMATCGHETARRIAASTMATPDKERGSIISSARRHTAFLEDERVVKAMTGSTCKLEDMKNNPQSVYLIIPPEKLEANNRMIRILLSVAIIGITRNPGKPKNNVLFLMDEFYQLGHMALVEKMISLIAGYGANFWIFLQDMSQLKERYQAWQTFVANCSKQFFNTSDLDTARFISDSLGQYTETAESTGSSSGSSTGGGGGSSNQGSSINFSKIGRNLMNPDEVMAMDKDLAIIMLQGERPYQLRKLNYLKQPEYAGKFGENPYHKALPSPQLKIWKPA